MVGRTPATRLSISALPSTSHGWHDLGVWYRDARVARQAAIRFDGHRYRRRGIPSLAPRARAAGRVVVDTTTVATRLYR